MAAAEDNDNVGALVGLQRNGSITASYATGNVNGGGGTSDTVGALVGRKDGGSITDSYGFGPTMSDPAGDAGSTRPGGVRGPADLTADNAGTSWNADSSNTLGAWDFGSDSQIPALKYADYDGTGTLFVCSQFPASVTCGTTFLPRQAGLIAGGASFSVVESGAQARLPVTAAGRVTISSWSWQQLEGAVVSLTGAGTSVVTFTVPDVTAFLVFEGTATDSDSNDYVTRISLLSASVVDRDGDGLIDIDSLTKLHNMRHDLAGTGYRVSATSFKNTRGCPGTGCNGYKLTGDLDFDFDGDGSTWLLDGDGNYSLDAGDHQLPYFEVTDGAGGWQPIGNRDNPFVAVFDGNGHRIRNLGIRRDQEGIGLFGAIGEGAVVRNLGLIANLADYAGSGPNNNVGGLVGWQRGGSITASYATGPANGGDSFNDNVGGLVGRQNGGSITASHARGPTDGRGEDNDYVGGLVGRQEGGSITASYATGNADGGGGTDDFVGGLVGGHAVLLSEQGVGQRHSIAASYATGNAVAEETSGNRVGGLLGTQLESGEIVASYATGETSSSSRLRSGGTGALVGWREGRFSIYASYGFGEIKRGDRRKASDGSPKPAGVERASQLTADNVGAAWNVAVARTPTLSTVGAWDFGTASQRPALKYADYDGPGTLFDCSQFPANACGTLLPGQGVLRVGGLASLESGEALTPGEVVRLSGSLEYGRTAISSWSWRQLAGPAIVLIGVDTPELTFTVPNVDAFLVLQLTAVANDGYEHSRRINIRSSQIPVSLNLARLELRLDRDDAAPLTLVPEGGGGGFDPGVRAYSAAIPFEARRAFIRAALTAAAPFLNPPEVRLFPVLADAGDGELFAPDGNVQWPLPGEEDQFEFRVQVSAEPLEGSNAVEPVTYTLILNRALPAATRLEVFPASDERRATPITQLDAVAFSADEDDMELILVVRDDNSSYAIGEVELGGSDKVELGTPEHTQTGGVFETRVLLRRVAPATNSGDIPFVLTLTATPVRPLAAGAGVLTAELRGTLLDNSPTVTEISATYRSHGQLAAAPGPAAPAGGQVRVSDNGPATITLEVVRASGGVRPFKQASFTLTVTPAAADEARLTRDGNRLEIAVGAELALSIAASGDNLEHIENPPPLAFTLLFVEPTASLQPQAGAAPLFNYHSELGDARPLFAFVGEDNRLSLAVTLDEDSTPLVDEREILRALPLTLTVPASMPGDVIVSLSAGASGEPARDLLFEAAQPQTGVAVELSVAAADVDERVAVAPLSFVAHLLRLEHEDSVAIKRERILSFSLEDELMDGAPGLNPGSSWTLGVANAIELADNGYEVEEVILVTPTTRVLEVLTRITIVEAIGTLIEEVGYTRETRTLVLRGEVVLSDTRTEPLMLSADLLSAGTLALFTPQMRTVTLVVSETEATYAPADADFQIKSGIKTRTLRLRRTDDAPEATASRLLLTFDYRPAAGPSGSFNRVVAITGREPALLARIFAAGRVLAADDDIVLPRGGSVVLELLLSNLLDGEEPLPEDISFSYPQGRQGLVIEPQQGMPDALNRRYVLPLRVSLAEDAAGPDYLVSIDVRLAGRTADARFAVDVNDPPQSDSDSPMTVLQVDESGAGPGGVKQFPLRIVDPDGGLQQLAAADLKLEVVGFAGIATFAVDGVSEERVPYFDLAFGPIEFQAGGEGDDFDNALQLTLTLTGKLATPPGAVVELRLLGATDGYEVLDQPLSVMVSDVPPTFSLETTTIPLVAGEVPAEVPLPGFTDGSRDGDSASPAEVLVLDAPEHLVVRFADNRVTVENLDPANITPETVRLVAFDSQGGRAQVELLINPVPQLPEIEAQHPLLVVAGATTPAVRRVMFVAPGTDANWTVPSDEIPDGVAVTAMESDDGTDYVDVAVTASPAAAGAEFSLEVTANDGDQQREVNLPVVVLAADPRPRLWLSVKAGAAVVSSFLTDTLSVEVALEGEGATLPARFTVTLSIAKIDPSTGMAAGDTLRQEHLLVVAAGALSIPLSVSGPTATLNLMASDLVEVSLTSAVNAVQGARLRLRVAAAGTALEELIDSDNDGLPDADAVETAPAALGPIAAAFARVMDTGARASTVVVLETEREPSLSLGNLARSVGLGDCGVVSLALTLNGGAVSVVEPDECENLHAAHPSLTPVMEALAADNFADGNYQLLDLRATFDSSATVDDELVLINLPAHPSPGQFYRVYRFDGTAFVPALSAGLPAAGSAAAPRVLAQVNDCDTCLYAVDGDRDGSVELQLLLESVAAAFSSEYQGQVLALPAAVRNQSPTLTIPLAELFGDALLDGIRTPAVRITQADGGGNVTGTLAMSAGLPALKLTGLRHTLGGAEEVRVQLLDGTTPVTGAVISLQVRVPNRPPVVTFLLDGEETDTLKLTPGTTETVVVVRLQDPDGGLGFFSLQLIIEGDSDIARLVPSRVRSVVAGAPVEVEHRLLLSSAGARLLTVKLAVTDVTDGSASESGALTVCFVDEDGNCPAPPVAPIAPPGPGPDPGPGPGAGSAGGGGGGGASGLLWLVPAAAAALVLATRRRRFVRRRAAPFPRP